MVFDYAFVLTGGISTGKSTVAKMFREDGFSVIDADKIAHQMLVLHKKSVVELFGEEYLKDNEIDRKRLGALIFSNPKEKKRLESLLHPLIYNEIERQAKELDRAQKPYLIDIPLFFENLGRYPIESSVVVYTPQQLQLSRLMKRDNSLKEEAESRIASQMDIEKKREKATYIIDNSKDLKHLQEEYVKVRDRLLKNFKEADAKL